jgi:hypothetical protein
MKARFGFVSNSSSSSFILSFDKKPESIDEMKKILFGNKEVYVDPYANTSYSAVEVSETVLKDIKDQTPMTREQISEELSCGWIEGAPDFSSFRTKPDNRVSDFEAYEKAHKEFTDKLADKLIDEAKGKVMFLVEYADDTSYGSVLEHGGLFDHMEHFRISKH